jgi:hypothetical protein
MKGSQALALFALNFGAPAHPPVIRSRLLGLRGSLRWKRLAIATLDRRLAAPGADLIDRPGVAAVRVAAAQLRAQAYVDRRWEYFPARDTQALPNLP